MRPIAFLIPGDLDLPTGGYGYDRAVIRLLPEHGVRAMHVALPGTFPNASAQDLADTAAIIRALPKEMALLIDGLAYGAMPAAMIRDLKRDIIALCHHPLALENGISAARAEALHASEQAALSLARHVIVTSAATARILVGDFGVPAGRISVAEPGTTRKPRAAGSGEPVLRLLAVGAIVPRKGYDVLIEALAGLPRRNWRLDIAGAVRSEPTRLALEAAIAAAGLSSQVNILGAVRDRELDDLYHQADLFVMSSLFEGYGMVLTEAMQRGLPIVTTTGGAASNTVPDGAGLKVPPGDVAALRAAVSRAVADPGLRAALSAAAWEAGKKLPTWDDTARIIAGVLKAEFAAAERVA